jgi:hypothetical protein
VLSLDDQGGIPLRLDVTVDSGSTPTPTRLLRWMRSKLLADNGFDSKQLSTLGCLVAAGAGAVFDFPESHQVIPKQSLPDRQGI